jgi:hypothetical protein
LFSKPKRVAARSAGQVERPARRQPLRCFYFESMFSRAYICSESVIKLESPSPQYLIGTSFLRGCAASGDNPTRTA